MKGTYAVSNISIADHLAITAHIMINDDKLKSKPTFEYREMKENNWTLFKHGIFNLKIRGQGIEEKWKLFLEDVKKTVESSFPKKTSKQKYFFKMSKGLMKSRDKKNDLLKKFKQGKINKEVYTKYNKCYRQLIKLEHENCFKKKLVEAGVNGKEKWKVIKEGLLLKQEFTNIKEINANGINLTEENDISLAFKTHFETCATNLLVGTAIGQDTSTALPQGDEWKFQPTNESELVKIIKTLKNKNSSGKDCLSNRMLKMEMYTFAKILKPLINESIETGIFPSTLKEANVIPVFKKGDKSNMNNYRPISLLPVLSKVYEKVLNIQITKIIDEGYIDDNQYGFRKEHSTEDAVLKFVDKIEKDLALGKNVATVYVDVSKAFDSVDHKILLTKLARTGMDTNGIKLMESYLKDRTQIIIVNNRETGQFYVINIGVPQGSILGPTLFKIYIMDLHCHTNLFCMKFADDTSLEGASNTKDELEMLMNNEMAKVNNWFTNNKLTLHPEKSKFIIHSKDKLVNIKLGDRNITRCGYGLQEESVCLLGLQIDENLDWKIHLQKIEKKIAKGNYLLWRHGKKMNIKLKKVIYESFIRCHLLYCITIWGGAKQLFIKPLNKVLHKAWSKIGGKKIHTQNRLKKFSLLKLEDELAIQESKLIWKWEHKKIAPGLANIINEKHDRLRGRRFNLERSSKLNSIHSRLVRRANKNIKQISEYTTKKNLAINMKKLIYSKYTFVCNTRNCYTCGNT